jgi:large subunit ribosomal protein L47
VRRTQRAIKQALTERYYSWREAEVLAQSDEEMNLSGDGPTYVPKDFIEENVPEENVPEELDGSPEARPNA